MCHVIYLEIYTLDNYNNNWNTYTANGKSIPQLQAEITKMEFFIYTIQSETKFIRKGIIA